MLNNLLNEAAAMTGKRANPLEIVFTQLYLRQYGVTIGGKKVTNLIDYERALRDAVPADAVKVDRELQQATDFVRFALNQLLDLKGNRRFFHTDEALMVQKGEMVEQQVGGPRGGYRSEMTYSADYEFLENLTDLLRLL